MNISIEQIRLIFHIRRLSRLPVRKLCKKNTGRLVFIFLFLFILVSQPPVQVQAQTAIDLELDGDGAMSWDFDNISPGDSGIKVLTLHNAGDQDGAISIWISDIDEQDYSSNGAALDDFLLFGITFNRLITNITMPDLIRNYPQNITDANFIRIDRLQAGETVTLTWEWEFPLIGENHNLAQGDSLSFTINYYFEELIPENITPSVENQPEYQEKAPPGVKDQPENQFLEIGILGKITKVQISSEGIILQSSVITSPDDICMLYLEENTQISVINEGIPGATRTTGTGGIPLGRIELTIEEKSIPLPDNTILLTPIYRLIGYDTEGNPVHIEFYPSIRLTMGYDPETIPDNSFPPYIARYSDEEGLIRLESAVKFLASLGRVDTLIVSSGLYTVLAEVAPPQSHLPVYFTASNLIISPRQAFEGDPVKISVTITNEGSEYGTYESYLIVDGIVRAIREVTLKGKSSETLSFEISHLAAGVHQVKVAGLIGTARIDKLIVEQSGSEVNWMMLDFSVAGVIMIGLLLWLLYLQRARHRATMIEI